VSLKSDKARLQQIAAIYIQKIRFLKSIPNVNDVMNRIACDAFGGMCAFAASPACNQTHVFPMSPESSGRQGKAE